MDPQGLYTGGAGNQDVRAGLAQILPGAGLNPIRTQMAIDEANKLQAQKEAALQEQRRKEALDFYNSLENIDTSKLSKEQSDVVWEQLKSAQNSWLEKGKASNWQLQPQDYVDVDLEANKALQLKDQYLSQNADFKAAYEQAQDLGYMKDQNISELMMNARSDPGSMNSKQFHEDVFYNPDNVDRAKAANKFAENYKKKLIQTASLQNGLINTTKSQYIEQFGKPNELTGKWVPNVTNEVISELSDDPILDKVIKQIQSEMSASRGSDVPYKEAVEAFLQPATGYSFEQNAKGNPAFTAREATKRAQISANARSGSGSSLQNAKWSKSKDTNYNTEGYKDNNGVIGATGLELSFPENSFGEIAFEIDDGTGNTVLKKLKPNKLITDPVTGDLIIDAYTKGIVGNTLEREPIKVDKDAMNDPNIQKMYNSLKPADQKIFKERLQEFKDAEITKIVVDEEKVQKDVGEAIAKTIKFAKADNVDDLKKEIAKYIGEDNAKLFKDADTASFGSIMGINKGYKKGDPYVDFNGKEYNLNNKDQVKELTSILQDLAVQSNPKKYGKEQEAKSASGKEPRYSKFFNAPNNQ